jgi:antitoxin (DNA-binding transcriptional repressor) of toxin-antitoxin stability system
MKTTTIRELRHDTTTVLGWVENGDTVEVRRRRQPVALLTPVPRAVGGPRPDFLGRLREQFGERVLTTTASALLAEERGER